MLTFKNYALIYIKKKRAKNYVVQVDLYNIYNRINNNEDRHDII